MSDAVVKIASSLDQRTVCATLNHASTPTRPWLVHRSYPCRVRIPFWRRFSWAGSSSDCHASRTSSKQSTRNSRNSVKSTHQLYSTRHAHRTSWRSYSIMITRIRPHCSRTNKKRTISIDSSWPSSTSKRSLWLIRTVNSFWLACGTMASLVTDGWIYLWKY